MSGTNPSSVLMSASLKCQKIFRIIEIVMLFVIFDGVKFLRIQFCIVFLCHMMIVYIKVL